MLVTKQLLVPHWLPFFSIKVSGDQQLFGYIYIYMYIYEHLKKFEYHEKVKKKSNIS